jgi:peptidoglycan hydrolase-like protein with peptidoglycan-binding domain
MGPRLPLRSAFAVAVIVLSMTGSVTACAADADAFKVEIETYFKRLGSIEWQGADKFTVRQDGDEAVAVIDNGHFAVRKDATDPKPAASIVADHIEIRRKPVSGGNDAFTYVISLPPSTTLTTPNGNELTLSLTDATATALVEGADKRFRELAASFGGGRVERKGGMDWLKFGEATLTSKISPTDGGGWVGPINFETKALEFLLADAPLAGKIDRIGYTGEAGGPSLADLDAFRDRIAELREKSAEDPAKNAHLWLAVLPKLFAVFEHSTGDLIVEGTTVKRPEGETLVTLAKATMDGSFTGIGGDSAKLRLTFGHEGLAIAPSLVPEPQVPQLLAVDIGLEDIAGAPLHAILDAVGRAGADASDADKQAMLPQIIGAAMQLKPVFKLYRLTVEFKDARIDATGEAQRGPPAPVGYTASGDVTVHGFDALSGILTAQNDRNYLPLLKFIGTPDTDTDGVKVLKFHLASETGKPLTINGSDVRGWVAGGNQFGRMPDGPPRLLRPTDPPETGDDVRAVQKAVRATVVEPLTDGVYDTATALAVARYQKQAGLNVSGVVDQATADKLGLKPPQPPPAPAKN